MRNKGRWLFWVDVANAVLMAGLIGTGVVMKWVLPPGSGGGGHGGGGGMGWRGGRGDGGAERVQEAARTWLDLGRHDWGDVHFWIAVAVLAGVLIHVALHWGWVKAATRQAFAVPKRGGKAVGHVGR